MAPSGVSTVGDRRFSVRSNEIPTSPIAKVGHPPSYVDVLKDAHPVRTADVTIPI